MSKVKILVEDVDCFEPTGVKVLVDGEEIAHEMIGGEPEDNCIARDYAWVVPTLRALAEKLGATVDEDTFSHDDGEAVAHG